MNEKALGHQLKKHRLANNFTLDGLAKAAGCSKSYLSQIENGLSSPSLAVLGTLASELGTSVASLLKENEGNSKTSWHLPIEKRQTLQYPTGLTSAHAEHAGAKTAPALQPEERLTPNDRVA